MGPSLNYSQVNHNFNNVNVSTLHDYELIKLRLFNFILLQSSKYSQGNLGGPQILNRTSPQSFLRTAMNNGFPQNSKANAQQYSSNKNVGASSGGPMSEITTTANGVQNSLANTSQHMQMHNLSSASNKQSGNNLNSSQLGGRLSHPVTNASAGGSLTINGSKANLADLNLLKLSQKSMK